MFIRSISCVLEQRIQEKRGKIQVLIGPRQIGKSTMVSQVLEKTSIPYTLAKADDVQKDDREWIHKTWDSARAQLRIKNESVHLLVIDEIQKIKNWSETVKAEWDWDTQNKIELRVVLLGSSRLMIQSGLTESLAGRFELIRMGHWTYQEMKTAFGFSLEEYIYFGGYPGAAEYIHDEKRWKRYMKDSIITPAIEQDALQTSRIYKPSLLKQLFTLGCQYSAKELSLTKMVGQLQDVGNVTTLADYLNLLSQCQLLTGLQKYANSTIRKYNSVPKLAVYNNALLSAWQRKTFQEVQLEPQLWGQWIESAVGAYLISQAEEQDYQVYYWRERSDEVDYIVVADNECIAIEVKSGRRHMNSGLNVFAHAFHPTHSYVIGTGGIPFEDFFQMPIEQLF